MTVREMEQGSDKQRVDVLVGDPSLSHPDLSSRNTQTDDRVPAVHSREGERTLGLRATGAAATSLCRIGSRCVLVPLARLFSRRGGRSMIRSRVAEGVAVQAGRRAAEARGVGGVAGRAEGALAAGVEGPGAAADGVSLMDRDNA